MSNVRTFKPERRLNQLMAEPGGILVAHALDKAGHVIEARRGDCLAAIDAKVDEVVALAASGMGENVAAIRQRANEIVGEAGVFGLAELSAAAHSLSRLLSAMGAAAPAAAVSVHVDAVRALRRPEISGDAQARGEVLKQLRKVVDRFLATGA